MREAVGAKALNAAALMIDADEDVGADRLDLGHELGELAPVPPVAAEQDQAARQRVAQAAAIVGVEREAGDVENKRSERVLMAHGVSRHSTTTKAVA